MTDLDRLEEAMGICFRDRSLLQRAVTHRSYLNENPDYPLPHNERLEFLGDAIVDFLVGEHLFHRFPEMQEGELTALRAALVRTEALAAFARSLDLGSYLLIGRGEESSGGRGRALLLAGAFEALVGALYLDRGLDTTREWVLRLVAPAARELVARSYTKDPKSLLQEIAQAQRGITPHYRTVAESGPDHAKEFTVQVMLGEEVWGEGSGRSKQIAAQNAARRALQKFGVEFEDPYQES